MSNNLSTTAQFAGPVLGEPPVIRLKPRLTRDDYKELEAVVAEIKDEVTREMVEHYLYGIRDCVFGGDKKFFIDKLRCIR